MFSSLILSSFIAFGHAGAAAGAAGRTLQFVNSCPFDVWIGGTGAAAECCDSNACGVGRSCGEKDGTCTSGRCFWTLPPPANSSDGGNPWHLTANTGKVTITLPDAAYPSPGGVQTWSGNVFGRTGCNPATGAGCLTAECQTGKDGGCSAGRGGNPPNTLVEFTLLKDRVDSYDVSILNGFNVPIEIAPSAGGKYQAGPDGAASDYWCVNAGGVSARSSAGNSTALLGCSWTFAPPGPAYAYVAQGGANCSLSGSCPDAGEVCGLAIPAVAPPTSLQPTCGTQLGWWSAFQICGTSLGGASSLGFNCSTPVPESDGPYGTVSLLYQCTTPAGGGAQSCYSAGADATCCGCENWTIGGKTVPATEQCAAPGVNSAWVSNVLPNLRFLKEACPMAYSYPYDDPSSSFQCQTTGESNAVNYVITYCPEGRTGMSTAAGV